MWIMRKNSEHVPTHFSETPLADDLQVVKVAGFYPVGHGKKSSQLG